MFLKLSKQLIFVGSLAFIAALAYYGFTDSRNKAVQASELLATSVKVNASSDTVIFSGFPTQQNGSLGIIGVGYVQTSNRQIARSLLGFDLTLIPADSQIVSATLSLYLAGTTQNDAHMTVSVHRILDPWREDINWQEHLSLQINSTIDSKMDVPPQRNRWYNWNVTELLKDWHNTPNHTTIFGLLLQGNETPGDQQRNFWSKDCPRDQCQGNQPILTIAYSIPTPTASNTPTSTPTPTATPIPKPGVAIVYLRNQPTSAIAPGELITYTIELRLAQRPAPYVLNSIELTNALPTDVEPIPISLTPPAGVTVKQTNGVLTWRFSDIRSDQNPSVQYQVRRLGPTATPTFVPTAPASTVTIQKAGPTSAKAKELIRYTLTVTNHSNDTLTAVVITDHLPANASYVAGGNLIDNVVQFSLPDLAAGASSLPVNLVVTATQTITNEDYAVSWQLKGSNTKQMTLGNSKVVTSIGADSVITPTPVPPIINHGASANSIYNGEVGTPAYSNVTYNPMVTLHFPFAMEPTPTPPKR